MKINHFFDPDTSTLTYLLTEGGHAVVIDPAMHFDSASGKLGTKSIDPLIDLLKKEKLNLNWILETHAHADHISAAPLLLKLFPQAKTGIGARIKEVQSTFGKLFNLNIPCDGSQFTHLFKEAESVDEGTALAFRVHSTAGHTPACVTYQFTDCLFTGDAIFMPDSGTGRCDFPGGSAESLFKSIHGKIYQFPDNYKIYVGHDYQPGGRKLEFESTVGLQKTNNIHLKAETSQADFIKFRSERDKTLNAPKLLLPSIQVNINGGRLPEPEVNGTRYLKLPIFQ